MDTIQWEITRKQFKKQKIKNVITGFGIAFVLISGLFGRVIFDPQAGLVTYFYVIGLMAFFFLLIIIPALVRPFSNHEYMLTNNGIVVSKNHRSKIYIWEDFLGYAESDWEIPKLGHGDQMTSKKFMLRTKRRALGLIKAYVIVYIDKDHAPAAEAMVKKHLSVVSLGAFPDFLPAVYEFE